MPWFPLSDKLHSDHRFAGLSADALALWTRAASWTAEQGNGGYVPTTALPMFNGADVTLAKELVDGQVWVRARGGFQIVDVPSFATKNAIEAKRHGNKVRQALHRDGEMTTEVRRRDGDLCRYCGVKVKWTDRRSAAGGTYDHIRPTSKGGKSQVENLVVACRGCNARKKDLTPEEAGMTLRPAPTFPGDTQPVTSYAPSSDQTLPMSYVVPSERGLDQKPSSSGGQDQLFDSPITARDVVGAWIDATRENGAAPSQAQIKRVGSAAKKAIEAGNDPELVLEAGEKAGLSGHANLDSAITWVASQRKGRHLKSVSGGYVTRDPETGARVEF